MLVHRASTREFWQPSLPTKKNQFQGISSYSESNNRSSSTSANTFATFSPLHSTANTTLEYWLQKLLLKLYSFHLLIAWDSASSTSASRAFVKRLSSIYGILTVRRRSRTEKSLPIPVGWKSIVRAWFRLSTSASLTSPPRCFYLSHSYSI